MVVKTLQAANDTNDCTAKIMITPYSAFFSFAIPMVYIYPLYIKMITYCFLQYPIRLYTPLFHVDTLSTKKKSASSALICCALHQREEAVWEPSFRVKEREVHHHPIMRILAGYSPMPPSKLRPYLGILTYFKGEKVPLKKTWQNLAASQISFIAPFVQHRYPQGVALLDDHVDSSTVASKYLGEDPTDPKTTSPRRCSTVEF